MDDIWEDRRVKIGYETAEELAKHANPLNWRGHPESQRNATEESLDTLGYVGSVKKSINSGVVLDGHLRIEIALAKDPSIQLPVDYYDLTPDEELLALQILDATTEMAEPIADKLATLLERTKGMTADKPGLSAMLEQLKARAGVNGNGQALPPEQGLTDKAEQLQQKWQVRPDDIWQIDRHFFICGDCREVDTWARLLSAAGVDKVNGVFTSPPYAEQRKAQYGGVPTAEYVEWWEAVQNNVKANLAGDGSFFVNIKPHCEDGQRVLYVFDLVLAMVRAWGWRFAEEFCWRRVSLPGQWPNRFKNNFEPVYQFAINDWKFIPANAIQPFLSDKNKLSVTGNHLHVDFVANGGHPGGVRSKELDGALPSNVIDTSFDGEIGHAAAFPVALPTFFINAYSDPSDIWLDPFLGSGTTIAAAHNENRTGLGIEKLPKYGAVILERLMTLTGKQPQRIDV